MRDDGGVEGVQFMMSGDADQVGAAVTRMSSRGWLFLSEPAEVEAGVWSMWVVAPPRS